MNNNFNVYSYVNFYANTSIAVAHENAMPVSYKEIVFTGTKAQCQDYIWAIYGVVLPLSSSICIG